MSLKPDVNSIIERVLSGDDLAFAELCAEYDPLIRSMSVKYAHIAEVTDEKEVVEDFSQEATLALYRAAQSYNGKSDQVSFGLYAKICIRNALVSELRRMNRKKKTDIAHRQEIETDRPETGRVLFGFPDVESILDGDLLSPFEKEVFGMYVGGMKIRQIAAKLGKPSKTVSNAVYRIKSKLRLSYK